MLSSKDLVIALITCVCSYLSLFGSLLIMISYIVARSKSTPKTAFLILHLAISDFIWFLAASIISSTWLTSSGAVPDPICYLAAPTIVFTRMASLIWTCVISFNVLMSVQKRKWFWKSQETDWEKYRKIYFCIIFIWGFPAALLTMISQYSAKEGDPLGCSASSESLGEWYIILFTEMIPITIAFLFNITAFFTVRQKMAKSAFPQSVRNKRKRVMYHYMIVCILCWTPQIVLELFQIFRQQPSFALDIFSRASLYISGFLNFLVFGMQDPYLKRSMEVMLYKLGFAYLAHILGLSYRPPMPTHLKSGDVEKIVMFQEETIVTSADQSKDRFSIYRNRKLSKEDKKLLYQDRPDLDPKFKIYGPNNGKPKKGCLKQSTNNNYNSSDNNTPTSNSNNSPLRRIPSTTGPKKRSQFAPTTSITTSSSQQSTSSLRQDDLSDDVQMETPLLSSYHRLNSDVSINLPVPVHSRGPAFAHTPIITDNTTTLATTDLTLNPQNRRGNNSSPKPFLPSQQQQQEAIMSMSMSTARSLSSNSSAAWTTGHDLQALSHIEINDISSIQHQQHQQQQQTLAAAIANSSSLSSAGAQLNPLLFAASAEHVIMNNVVVNTGLETTLGINDSDHPNGREGGLEEEYDEEEAVLDLEEHDGEEHDELPRESESSMNDDDDSSDDEIDEEDADLMLPPTQ
jgi:hypothetical protein